MNDKPSPSSAAAGIRHLLSAGGSANHAKGVQWFFQEEIKSHGWYTAALRHAAVSSRRGVGKLTGELGEKEFRLFESWLGRIRSWADQDALVHDLITHMVFTEAKRLSRVFEWSKSPDRWHRRVCGADPRNTPGEILAADHAAFELTPSGRGRHGAERAGLAPARNGESESRPHHSLSREDSL